MQKAIRTIDAAHDLESWAANCSCFYHASSHFTGFLWTNSSFHLLPWLCSYNRYKEWLTVGFYVVDMGEIFCILSASWSWGNALVLQNDIVCFMKPLLLTTSSCLCLVLLSITVQMKLNNNIRELGLMLVSGSVVNMFVWSVGRFWN